MNTTLIAIRRYLPFLTRYLKDVDDYRLSTLFAALCEKRRLLLERVAREHPRFKFRVLGDGLYRNSVFIDICDRHKWKYSFTSKGETRYPKLLFIRNR
ncbi:MAG: hypothetical protein GXP32_05790 [Kiritimatiellaeota bacterium]|nr:hypothetical protein [Kiritimatiellota bacterium]